MAKKKVNRFTTLAEFARRWGVSRAAVTKAVSKGRLRDSVQMVDGRPVIVDIELADREWGVNRQSSGAAAPPASTGRTMAALDEARVGGRGDEVGGVPSIAVSRARFEAARAALTIMELSEKKGKLVSVEQVRAAVTEKFATVRTRLLAAPTRIKQRLPRLTLDDIRVIDSVIREALEELADGGADEDPEP